MMSHENQRAPHPGEHAQSFEFAAEIEIVGVLWQLQRPGGRNISQQRLLEHPKIRKCFRSSDVRHAIFRLIDEGSLDIVQAEDADYFRLTPSGLDRAIRHAMTPNFYALPPADRQALLAARSRATN
ncbi:hypothetical protein [uncultured Abyssibacter sp.]|uniref:hypothetical protein n=1 Tax=uncultured Abyssibacter sp. TaxID=2320202 RepID=UPI0032B24D88|tara:strand:+ start:113 stop:490 length:378 start_codon:yes stop_codon:yes gene_type:complete